MSAETTNESNTDPAAPTELPPVTVTLDLPGRLVRDLDLLVRVGLYLSREEAVRQALLHSWKFERGSFHTLRIDTDKEADEDTDTGADKAEAASSEG